MSQARDKKAQTKLPCALHFPLNMWQSERSELLVLPQGFSLAFSACKMSVRGRRGRQSIELRSDVLESRGADRRGLAPGCFLFPALNHHLEQIQPNFFPP